MPAAKSRKPSAKGVTPKIEPPKPQRAPSVVDKAGQRTCVGACRSRLPVTRFPTYRNGDGVYVRAGECRACKAAKRTRKDTK